MSVLVLGAGGMGEAVARSLARVDALDRIVIADPDGSRARGVSARLADRRVTGIHLDVTAPRAVREAMSDAEVVIAATAPFFLRVLAEAAIDSRTHYSDVCEDERTISQVLSLDRRAREAGVTLIPGCGLEPGLFHLLTIGAVDELDVAESVTACLGCVPPRPGTAFDYPLSGSAERLIETYTQPASVLRDGTPATVPPLSECETIRFPPPYETMEACTVNCRTALIQALRGRVRALAVKVIRAPGHSAVLRAVAGLGLFDGAPRRIDGAEVAPRRIAVHLLEERQSEETPDAALLRVTARGTRGGGPSEVRYEMVEAGAVSGMHGAAGASAACIAMLLGTGNVAARGALPVEVAVAAAAFVAGLEEFGLRVDRVVAPA